jgi:hydroxymethylbilane synthase
MKSIRIGTRGSPLALWQARHTQERLQQLPEAPAVELVIIETQGDRDAHASLARIGGEGVFTKAIQDAVLAGKADVAVHSMKDLPTALVPGLTLAAVPPRASVFDALVSHKHRRFDDLPKGARVATGSLRRRAQLLYRRPDLHLTDMRGNIDTRLRKLSEMALDGLILAEAGLSRLGIQSHISELLSVEWMLPAVGQGALGLECRSDDHETSALVARLDDYPSRQGVLAERAVLRALGGGCQVPLGVHSQCAMDRGEILLTGAVLSADGRQRVAQTVFGRKEPVEALGTRLADMLIQNGAREILG